MRVGLNPVKITRPGLRPAADVTVVVVNFIPYLYGYFERGLDVLRLCLESLWENTTHPYDLLVFDNGSCSEVRRYLIRQSEKDRIDYLILSDRNVGLPGAWNFAFAAAPGEYIAYSDNDIYYHPGWLDQEMRVMNTYPHVGMVTGIPLRSPLKFSMRTLEWAQADAGAEIERGLLQDFEIYRTHGRSMGFSEARAKSEYQEGEDIRIVFKGVETFIGAGHFQFLAPRAEILRTLPLPTEIAMGNERHLDKTLDGYGLLRLSLPEMYVQHMGNVPSEALVESSGTIPTAGRTKLTKGRSLRNAILDIPLLKRVLLYVHGRIFHWYYSRMS